MKKLIILMLLFTTLSGHAQSQKFKDAWNFTQSCITKIDSACNVLQVQKTSIRRKRTKVKMVEAGGKMTHTLIAKYRAGHLRARHKYKATMNQKIRVIEDNGQIVMIDMHWKKENVEFHSFFTSLGNEKWLWSYEAATYSANTTLRENFVETADHWAK